jgi:hypothetical protein
MADFTSKTVHSSLMLLGDGVAGAGSYVRSRKNVITSPALEAHLRRVASGMKACSTPDACTRDPKKVGTSNAAGKVYRMCSLEECKAKLIEAQQCGKRTLPGL